VAGATAAPATRHRANLRSPLTRAMRQRYGLLERGPLWIRADRLARGVPPLTPAYQPKHIAHLACSCTMWRVQPRAGGF
jgi:hypothetical protein